MNNSKRQYCSGEGDHHSVEDQQHSKRMREDDSSQKPLTRFYTGNNTWRPVLYIESDVVPYIAANLVPRVVNEEVSRAFSENNTREEDGNQRGASKPYKLVFENELDDEIFTNSKIKAKGGKAVEIALRDATTGSVLTRGAFSSMDIKLCVFSSEFGGNGNGDWSTKEFKDKILRQRHDKGELLKGDTVIRLENGVARITKKLEFTDNSRWTRGHKFRLGAMVHSTSIEANIKEAISMSFRVKDKRGEAKKKHYPPSWNDEIWRLENIGKDGKIHRRLSAIGINTVGDLFNYQNHLPLLQQKYGKISRKLQEAIEHARTCNREVIPHKSNTDDDLIISHEKKQRVERGKQHVFPNDGGIASAYNFPIPSLADINPLDQLGKRQEFSQPSTSAPQFGGASSSSPYNDNQLRFPEHLNSTGNDDFCFVGSNNVPAACDENGFPYYQTLNNDFSFSHDM